LGLSDLIVSENSDQSGLSSKSVCDLITSSDF